MTPMEQTYFRKGLGLKKEVAGALSADYHSRLVDRVREQDYQLSAGGLTFRLAREFGFCYGVDRAVEYAYQVDAKFPDKRVFLVGEIIHNPHVNDKLEGMGITVLRTDVEGRFDFAGVNEEDVVIIPAFGVTVKDLEQLRDIGCVLIDTTCGSVLNVWKRVEKYAKEGYTALIHGKHFHEESKATASQVTRYPGGKYLIVRNMEEALVVCRFIEEEGDPKTIEKRFEHAMSPGLSAERDLSRIGIANQTTMLANESLAIAARMREAMIRRFGEEALAEHFQSFDTICSATQERQDAVLDLIGQPLDAMIVIGGYNSSNTNHLAKICSERTTTYHINDADCIDPERGTIRHKPVGGEAEVETDDWLACDEMVIGITAGASTPNNKIGEAMERTMRSREVEQEGGGRREEGVA
ncbi:MAG: 4-hydroxy-3-methylbut-2-enyl diphosphate reductase [Gemmatimonadetes bacterium]|nr:4-hydroxy-3-methylbut-2-enyl diphosphate reductase [Gemmatimonadota bacterium]